MIRWGWISIYVMSANSSNKCIQQFTNNAVVSLTYVMASLVSSFVLKICLFLVGCYFWRSLYVKWKIKQLVYIFFFFLSCIEKHVNIKGKNMACMIHYKSLGNYSELKNVTTNTEIGFRKAKAIRERIKG